MTSPINYHCENGIGFITIDYPPVNALSQVIRAGLVEGITQFESNDEVKVIIIRCEKRTFIAGADIKEFGKPPLEPHLPDVVNRIESCSKPVIASLFGTSLGGGFEVALACHYRIATSDAKVGLPEVNLGLIPGAGGTQRLPRIVATKKALEMITSGKHYSVSDFSDSSLFNLIVSEPSELDKASINFAQELISSNQLNPIRTGEQTIVDDIDDWQEQIKQTKRKARGRIAPLVAASLIHNSIGLDINEGMKNERQEFVKLRDSEQSAALRYSFGIERAAAKTKFTAEPLSVEKVGVIGGGTMGSGIATAFLTAGFKVVLIEQNQQALAQGQHRIENNFAVNLKRGRMTETQVEDHINSLSTSVDYQALADCDLVIEAVFENMQVKKEIFSKLTSICKSQCILATNTSYLDINEIAASCSRPEQVIGMHFFSPANIMKLLEIVQAEKSSEQALVSAMAVAKRLKKISVLVGVCFGFAGNRMYTRYGREVQQMLLEGAKVAQIDKALTNWGMAMGPLAVADMSGIDIGVSARRSQPFPEHDKGYFKPSELMVDQQRFGRKTGSGYYQYDEKGHPVSDPEVDESFQKLGADLGIAQREFNDDEIVLRTLYALISEGLQLLKDGIVQRASDIDVIWQNGYGFPKYKGGPMFQVQQIGVDKLAEEFEKFRDAEGENIWPAVDLSLV